MLSAIKFALVAMYYMHLKNDSKLFSGVFVFPLIIAAVVILALIALQAYHWAFARSGDDAAAPRPLRTSERGPRDRTSGPGRCTPAFS